MSPSFIIRWVAEQFGISVRSLTSVTKIHRLSWSRLVAYWLLRRYGLCQSLSAIAQRFHRDLAGVHAQLGHLHEIATPEHWRILRLLEASFVDAVNHARPGLCLLNVSAEKRRTIPRKHYNQWKLR